MYKVICVEDKNPEQLAEKMTKAMNEMAESGYYVQSILNEVAQNNAYIMYITFEKIRR